MSVQFANATRRRFNHNGLDLEEIIIEREDEKTLAWAFYPFDKMRLDDGRPNPCHYVKFTTDEKAARQEAELMFNDAQKNVNRA